MTSGIPPLLVGFAAAALLLIPVALLLAFRRFLERMRLRPKRRGGPAPAGAAVRREWMYRSRARGRATFGLGAGNPGSARSDPHDGRPEGPEESPADGSRQTQEVLEEADLEAKAIVAAAQAERTERLTELARDLAAIEETRTKLSRFLTDVLEEIDDTRSADGSRDNVHQLGEARDMKTAASADQ
jgi:hypothetical protein